MLINVIFLVIVVKLSIEKVLFVVSDVLENVLLENIFNLVFLFDKSLLLDVCKIVCKKFLFIFWFCENVVNSV